MNFAAKVLSAGVNFGISEFEMSWIPTWQDMFSLDDHKMNFEASFINPITFGFIFNLEWALG